MSSLYSEPDHIAHWLTGIPREDRPALLFYHADVDGCVSATYWVVLLSHYGWTTHATKVLTADLDFRDVETLLGIRSPRLAVFLDLPAGTRFKNWTAAFPRDRFVFVYDHHDTGQSLVSYPPHLIQFAADRPQNLPPTCLFSHNLYGLCVGAPPDWLVTVGLLGEGQHRRFPEYLTAWTFARPVVRLIAHGVLRDDNAALDYLTHYLASGTTPPNPETDPLTQPLRHTSRLVARAIEQAVATVLRSTGPKLLSGLINSDYPIANYVASDARRLRPNHIVIVGECTAKHTIRAEIRLGRDVHVDLRQWVQEAKQLGLLLGGGGHPAAVGARLTTAGWPIFVQFLESKAAREDLSGGPVS